MATLKDIAKACNVSYSTVSRAFDPSAPVQASVRTRILEYAKSINYIPNTLARGLRQQRTSLVGVILHNHSRVHFEYNLSILRCYESFLKREGFHLITMFVANAQEERIALQQMIGLHVEALLFQPFGEENIDLLESARVSIAMIQIGGYLINNFDTVIPDDTHGMLCAMNYLLNKGHKNILFVAPEGDCRASDFQNILNAQNIPYSPKQILLDWKNEQDIHARILEIHPTAILGISHGAGNAYSTLMSLKIRIPEEISFMAYDDLQWTRISKVSVMTHNLDEMGKKVAQLVTKRLNTFQKTGTFPAKTVRLHVPLRLIDRGSVSDIDAK